MSSRWNCRLMTSGSSSYWSWPRLTRSVALSASGIQSEMALNGKHKVPC